MPDSLGAASVGKQVLADRYELCDVIGQGGMAEVHRAHDRLLDRTVAVKIFRPRDDPAAQRRFDDEGRALARLGHPGLVAIFDVGAVDDRPFLVMEFVEGQSLHTRLQAGPLPLDRVLRIGGSLADALAHAHQRGVVHRDVKPSNILLDRDDLPHLTDFGIALLVGSPRLTSVHEVLGTPAYLAPEQVAETEIGPPADVYALGLVLLECLSGEPEYASGSCLEVALSRLNRPPRIPAGLPPALIDLLTAMTATEAGDRPTAQRCALRLRALLDDDSTSEMTPPQPVPLRLVAATPAADDTTETPAAADDATKQVPRVPATAARRRPRWRLVAASVAGIAAAVAALVLLLNWPQPLAGHPQTAAAGTSSGSSAHPSAGPRAAHAAGTSAAAWTRSASPTGGMFVANAHSAPATAPTTAPAATGPSTSTVVRSVPTTTAPATTTPRPTSVAAQPSTVASSAPPATTTSTDPPSTSDASGSGPGDTSSP